MHSQEREGAAMRVSFLRLRAYPSWSGYAVALLCVSAAALITPRLSAVLSPNIFPLFFAAVIISAWYGGFKPGALATVLSVAMISYLSPERWLTSTSGIIRLGTFVLVSLLISWLIGALYQSIAAVRERETWFQEIFEASRDAVFLVNERAEFIEVNRAACELTGYSRDELLKMSIPDLHDEADLEAFNNYFHSIMEGEDVASEAFVRRKEGGKILVEFSNRRMVFRGHAVMHTTGRDVTERRRIEERLQQSERQLATAQQVAHIGSWEWDTLTDQASWSEELYRIMGLEPHECTASLKTVLDLIHPFDKEFVRDVLDNALKDHGPFDIYNRIVRPDGAVRTMHSLGETIVEDGRVKMIGTAQDVTERKRAEEALRRAEEKYRSIFENAVEGIFQSAPEGRFIVVNPAMARMFGFESPEEMVSARTDIGWQHYVGPQSRDSLRRLLDEQGVAEKFEAEVYRKDRSKFWTSENVRAVRDVSGALLYYEGFIEDITERKRAEAALLESEARLEEAQRMAHLGYWEHDYLTSRMTLSEEASQILGMPPGRGSGDLATGEEQWREAIHPEDLERVLRAAAEALGGGAQYDVEYRLVHPDGEARTLHSKGDVTWDESGRPARMFGFVQDITDVRQAEQELRASESRFRTFVDHATDAFFLFDDAATILDVNSQACESLGYTREELIGMTPFDFDPDADEAGVEQVRARLEAGKVVAFDRCHRRKDGAVFPVEVRCRPFRQGGRMLSVSLVRDITERKRAEEALRESQKQYEALVNSVDGIVWELDLESFRFSFVSKSAERILGYPLSMWLDEPHFWEDRLHLDDRAWAVNFSADATARREDHQFEYRMIAADGHVVWLRDYVTVNAREDDSVYLCGVMVDITERKRAEEDWQQQKEILQKIFDHIPAMVDFVDSTGAILMVNREWERVTGWSSAELPGRDILAEFYPNPEYRRYVLDCINSATGEWRDFKTRVRSGKVLDTSWANVKLSDGTSIGIGQDVTERKRAEEAREQLLREREQLLASLVKAQEDERRRIARELHDQLGQQITALMLGIKWLKHSGHCQPLAMKHLDRLQEYADQLSREVHHIAWELRPAALDDLGLHTALGNYLEKWAESSGKRAELHSSGFNGHRLSTQIETTLYRVIQEALTNVAKHSEAECVSLILERRDNHVLAIIEDDGRGFNFEAVMSAPESEHKLGLLGMRERLASVFGTLDIESTPDAGTSVFVRIPTPPIESERVIR